MSRAARDPFIAGDYGSLDDWRLGVPEHGIGRLRFLPGEGETMRVDYAATAEFPWSVQLSKQGFVLEENGRYRLSFRARADRPRPLTVLCLEAQAPFNNLGLYQRMELTEAWHKFRFEFPASAADDNAVVSFNLGDSETPIEIQNVTMEKLPAP